MRKESSGREIPSKHKDKLIALKNEASLHLDISSHKKTPRIREVHFILNAFYFVVATLIGLRGLLRFLAAAAASFFSKLK